MKYEYKNLNVELVNCKVNMAPMPPGTIFSIGSNPLTWPRLGGLRRELDPRCYFFLFRTFFKVNRSNSLALPKKGLRREVGWKGSIFSRPAIAQIGQIGDLHTRECFLVFFSARCTASKLRIASIIVI